jgi:hypothetical protein
MRLIVPGTRVEWDKLGGHRHSLGKTPSLPSGIFEHRPAATRLAGWDGFLWYAGHTRHPGERSDLLYTPAAVPGAPIKAAPGAPPIYPQNPDPAKNIQLHCLRLDLAERVCLVPLRDKALGVAPAPDSGGIGESR